MATKIALEVRRTKLKALIAQGLKPQEIMEELKIPRRTFYNDLAIIQQDTLSDAQKQYSMEKMLGMRDELLRGFMLKRKTARSDEIFMKAGIAADNCLTNLIKDFARLGLVPQEKQTLEMQGNMGLNMTDLKLHALAAIEREKQDAKSEEPEE